MTKDSTDLSHSFITTRIAYNLLCWRLSFIYQNLSHIPFAITIRVNINPQSCYPPPPLRIHMHIHIQTQMHTLTHSLSLTHSLTLPHTLAHNTYTHSLTLSLTHSLTHPMPCLVPARGARSAASVCAEVRGREGVSE